MRGSIKYQAANSQVNLMLSGMLMLPPLFKKPCTIRPHALVFSTEKVPQIFEEAPCYPRLYAVRTVSSPPTIKVPLVHRSISSRTLWYSYATSFRSLLASFFPRKILSVPPGACSRHPQACKTAGRISGRPRCRILIFACFVSFMDCPLTLSVLFCGVACSC